MQKYILTRIGIINHNNKKIKITNKSYSTYAKTILDCFQLNLNVFTYLLFIMFARCELNYEMYVALTM